MTNILYNDEGETSANGVLSANNDQVAVSTVCKDERHSPSQVNKLN